MEEVLLRFGHIGDQILEELDSSTLSKCNFVGKSWKSFIDKGRVQPFRIIKTMMNINEDNLKKHTKKINTERVIDLANTVRKIYQRLYPKNAVNPKSFSNP